MITNHESPKSSFPIRHIQKFLLNDSKNDHRYTMMHLIFWLALYIRAQIPQIGYDMAWKVLVPAQSPSMKSKTMEDVSMTTISEVPLDRSNYRDC